MVRALVPESEVFLRAHAQQRAMGATTGKKTRVFIKQAGAMLKKHWLLCIYAVLLMAGTSNPYLAGSAEVRGGGEGFS